MQPACSPPPSQAPPRAARELTLTCFERQPLLASDARCHELADILNDVLPRHGLTLAAFVFLPAQARMLVTHPVDSRPRLAWVGYVVKRVFEQRAREALQTRNVPLLRTLVQREGRGRYVFRFWQPGEVPVHALDGPDEQIAAVRSMHLAPVQAGYCAHARQWRWSSWHDYHGPPPAAGTLRPHVEPLPLSS